MQVGLRTQKNADWFECSEECRELREPRRRQVDRFEGSEGYRKIYGLKGMLKGLRA